MRKKNLNKAVETTVAPNPKEVDIWVEPKDDDTVSLKYYDYHDNEWKGGSDGGSNEGGSTSSKYSVIQVAGVMGESIKEQVIVIPSNVKTWIDLYRDYTTKVNNRINMSILVMEQPYSFNLYWYNVDTSSNMYEYNQIKFDISPYDEIVSGQFGKYSSFSQAFEPVYEN